MFLIPIIVAFYTVFTYKFVEQNIISFETKFLEDRAISLSKDYLRGRDLPTNIKSEFYTVRLKNGLVLESSKNTYIPFTRKNPEFIYIGKSVYIVATVNYKDLYVQFGKSFNLENKFLKKLRIILFIGFIAVSSFILGIFYFLLSYSIKLSEFENFSKFQNNVILSVGHAVKTPISTAILILEDKMSENKDSLLEIARDELWNLQKRVESLLKIAKIEGTNLKFESFDICKEIENIIKAYKNKAKIELTCEEKSILINSNKEILKEVLELLIDNAVKHGKEKEQIFVNIKDKEIQIKNKSDKPINEDNLFKAFTKKGDLSIGLYVAKKFCDAIKADIKLVQEKEADYYSISFILKL